MIVKILHETLHDYRSAMSISIDDKKVFDVMDGEPEDSNLSRDFNDCYSIGDMMRAAYEAGKAGETFEVVTEETSDADKGS